MDGDSSNNLLDNLMWESRSANCRRRGVLRGNCARRRKLTWKKVQQIRRLSRAGYPQRRLSAMFGVSQPNIGYILRGKIWQSEK